MLIVSSTLIVKSEFRDVALALAQQHVAASLEEPGCISHAVYIHPDNANEFFFFERWRDDQALQIHFTKPYAIELVSRMQDWAAEPMTLTISNIEGEKVLNVGSS